MQAGFSGVAVLAEQTPKFTADFSIDGHSHIQSGATAPLPLIWSQMGNIHLNRSVLDTLAPFAVKGGKIQRQKTEEIGDILASELVSAYMGSKLLQEKPYKDGMTEQQKANELFSGQAHIFSPAMIMPMDMDFAHIAGYPPESSTIYHEGKFDKWISMAPEMPPTKITVDGVYYFDRKEAPAPENKGVLVDVSHERPNQAWVFQSYYFQHISTIASVKKNPWQLIPMFHYDPRRWCNPSGGEMDDDNWIHGPWDEPFKYIATLKNAGIFIGFKMYPPLGYKPLDPRLPNLEKFYARCEAEGIPILTHCSPGGMTTHEAKFYNSFDKADLTNQPSRIVSCTYDPCTPLGYFFDEYVHPKNWRPVLMKFPKLKICLAHFGGAEWDEIGLASDWVEEITNLCDPKIVQGHNSKGEIHFENVYTDLSCYNLEDSSTKKNVAELFRAMKFSGRYRHLQDKVIFGVDWYLSLITGAPEYRQYVESFFDAMGDCDKWQWYRSALVNPATFYGLDISEIIENMDSALKSNKADREKRSIGYDRISRIKEQVETIRKELGKLKPEANK
jgi:Amidohydrolase